MTARGSTVTGGMMMARVSTAMGGTTIARGRGDGRHNDGKGQHGDRQFSTTTWHEDGDGRHNDGKGQQGDRQHDNAGGDKDDTGVIGTSVILLSFGPGDVGRGK